MNLINKRLLAQKIETFEFPTGEKYVSSMKLIEGWQKALKDSDLEKTKEKTVQGKFLNTFFEEILGYTDVTTGQTEWTLIQHPRIENDSMEPDGSLGWFTKDEKHTRAVIELKDAKTALDKKQLSRAGKYTPIEQAYLYSTKYEGCNWIIVSNFKEIRLYNKQKTQDYYERFDVLGLNKEEEFKRFYYLLSQENLLSKDKESVVDILAKNTVVEEQNITKKFYNEFKQIRLNLLNHLIDNNPEVQKDILLEKTQKLLDRLIFTLVCEDTSSLLPLSIVKNTYERAINSLSPSDERVWTEFKGLFMAIDKGNSRVKPPINAYNGGLFAFDSILDNLKIKDEAWEKLVELANYDFETDLNVNILGHIFEQSISDLESIKESLTLGLQSGGSLLTQDGDKIEIGTKEKAVEKVGKRKKDGIYYTPEYITRFIVENTVGRYLEEHPEKLETIKILDPACGSGAFLNQAHSFLRTQWNIAYQEGRVKNKDAELGGLFDFNPVETDKSILLNNLFGVDLNQESVEITKLSLWLKTARKSAPLQNLDKNVKSGNSLVDDTNIVGQKAFIWQEQFKDIMNEGGFDVIIGNPPYVKLQNFRQQSEEQHKFLVSNYLTTQSGNYDLYIPFIERAYNLLKPGGYLGFIAPNVWIFNEYGKALREFVKINNALVNFVDFKSFQVFSNVTTYTAIQIFKKGNTQDFQYTDASSGDLLSKKTFSVSYEDLNSNIWSLTSKAEKNIMKKMELKGKSLEDVSKTIFQGIVTSADDIFHLHRVGDKIYNKFNELVDIESDILKPLVSGTEAKRYVNPDTNKLLIFPYKTKDVTSPRLYTQEEMHNHFPKAWSYLTSYESELKKRENNKMDTDKWYGYVYPKGLDKQDLPKLIVATTVPELRFCIDDKGQFACNNVRVNGILTEDNEYTLYYLLGILNSKPSNFYFKQIAKPKDNGFYEANKQFIAPIPVPTPTEDLKKTIEEAAKRLVELYSEINTLTKSAIELLITSYEIKSTLKIERISDFGFNQLIEEIEKQKINLTLNQKEELQIWFKDKQIKFQSLKQLANNFENKINSTLYRKYDFSDEEIAIIEGETL